MRRGPPRSRPGMRTGLRVHGWALRADTASTPALQAAVGRRLRVYWPEEQAWFCGMVTRFDVPTGRHHVSYDDGDSEELMLAAERIEWLPPATEAPAPARAPVELLPIPAAPSSTAGRRSLVRRLSSTNDSATWPPVGDLVWGRVKVRELCCTAACASMVRALTAAPDNALRRATAGGRAESWTPQQTSQC